MAKTENRFDIQNKINNENGNKQLPNFFNKNDEIEPIKGFALSILIHLVFTLVLILISLFHNLIFPLFPKPELPVQDIEFVLVQKESKPPINKNTKLFSDKDSQAGGIHDPKKPVSEPKPTAKKNDKNPSGAEQKIVKQTPKTISKPVVKQQPKQQPKTVQKQQPQPQKVVQQPKKVQEVAKTIAPAKPTPIKAPSVKPRSAPVASAPKITAPSAPKITSAPKSPFNVPVTGTKAPVGTTYKPTTSTGTSGSTGGSSKGTAAPAPKFSSSSGGSSSGSSGSAGSSGNPTYASRGSGGYGGGGNPSPGNPNGTPGIDARKEPNWGPYIRDLEQRIKKNWTPPKGDSSKRVVITFSIRRDGHLLSSTVTKSSGSTLADRAAQGAIEATAPFRPLPPEYDKNSIQIVFTFDYNVLNGSMK